MSLSKRLLALLPALLLALLPATSHAARPKNDSPGNVVRDFYTQAEKYVPTSNERASEESFEASLFITPSRSYTIHQLIKKNGGLSSIKALKIGQEQITKTQTGSPPETTTTHVVQVDYELRFKNGSVRKSQATLKFHENFLVSIFSSRRGDTEWEITEITDLNK